ncbi:MAG: FoF1 ATP synthase subunit gamma [Bdellovibrio bacteriovorus]
MSRRRELDSRLASLRDIGKIMASMKNLSYMETRKLGRCIESQGRVVAGIEAAARDFLDHYPQGPRSPAGTRTLHVVIGAERGFCGDFNGAVLEALEPESAHADPSASPIVTVGTRLAAALEGHPRLVASIQGASAAEEVPTVLNRLVQTLGRILEDRGAGAVGVIHWDAQTQTVREVSLLPPFQGTAEIEAPRYACPPGLNLAPAAFLAALIKHYLFAALHALLYSSLMAEHQQRVRHLEGALERIDGRVRELEQHRNLVRQEEITEEIELMLLNLTERAGPASDDPTAGSGTTTDPALGSARP